jgi:hypothetical protein
VTSLMYSGNDATDGRSANACAEEPWHIHARYGYIGHKIGLDVIPDHQGCHSRPLGVLPHFSGLAVGVSR